MPLVLTPADFQDRTSDSLVVIGKLRPGIAIGQAQREMDAIAAGLGREYPASNSGSGVRLVSLRDQLVGGMVESFLFTLLGAALVVLVLAAANVLQLLLIRAEVRERAVALRVALGGRRGDVLWPLMAESTTLAILGGLAGLGLASWLISLLVKVLPAFIPNRDRLGIDAGVVWFTVALAAAIGVIVALAPALRTFRSDLTQIFKEGADKGAVSRRPRLQKVLAVSEVALALLLLCSAGLLLRSFLELRHTRPGFDPDHLLTIQLALPQASYPQDSQTAAFSRRLHEELVRLPGVRAAGAVTQLPLSGSNSTRTFIVEGHPLPPGSQAPEAYYRVATTGYFRAMGIPLIAGRDFLPSDDAQAAPRVIVSQTMAKLAWPGEDPLGKRLSTSTDPPLWREVIGVVGDVKHWGLDDPKTPFLYAPLYAAPRREMGWAIRVAGSEQAVVPEVRDVIRRLDPNLPGTVAPMSALMERSMTVRKVSALLFGQMSAVALLLGLVGLYSVIHYMTARRRREIAIYMALGAQRSQVVMLMLRQGFWLVALGLGGGLAAALAATRLMKGLLFGVDPLDAVTLTAALVLLGGVGLLAVLIPARRATLVDPVVALRNE
jgi:putative ABC transport system permease protein